MTIENMKDFLIHRYPGSKWAERVKTMPDEQVIAIYSRLQQATPPKVVHAPPISRPIFSYYICRDCFREFAADNPDLRECRFCGSKNIKHEFRIDTVRKGEPYEN